MNVGFPKASILQACILSVVAFFQRRNRDKYAVNKFNITTVKFNICDVKLHCYDDKTSNKRQSNIHVQ